MRSTSSPRVPKSVFPTCSGGSPDSPFDFAASKRTPRAQPPDGRDSTCRGIDLRSDSHALRASRPLTRCCFRCAAQNESGTSMEPERDGGRRADESLRPISGFAACSAWSHASIISACPRRTRGNRISGGKCVASANHASGASSATDGKPRAKGRVRRSSRTSGLLQPAPGAAVSRAVERFAEQHASRRQTLRFRGGLRAGVQPARGQQWRMPCRRRSRRMRRVRACCHSSFAESPLLAADATRPLRTPARSLPARAPTES